MRKRYLVLGLSVFLALALAVPALGGPSNPVAGASATAKAIAQKALKKAKAAQKTANQAKSTANTALSNAAAAQSTANSAQSDANQAKTAAAAAQTSADNAQTAADAANANANTRYNSVTEVSGGATADDTSSPKSAFATCPAGSDPTGGGYSIGGTTPGGAVVTSQHVQLYGGGWFASARTQQGLGATSWSIAAFAECASK
jgi:membrane protein involved in colicin uptake